MSAPWVATLLALVFLATSVIAFDHHLHQVIHPEAGQGHHCLLSSLLQGQLNLAEPSVSAIAEFEPLSAPSTVPQFPGFSRMDLRLDPGRAPPSDC